MEYYSKPPILKRLSVIFTIFVLLVILLIGYFFTGEAEITIYPTIKSVSTDFDIIGAENTTSLDSNQIVVDIFSEQINSSQTYTLSETNEERFGRATGEINIINNNSSDQTLVERTRFLTPDNVQFRLTKTVVIPRNSSLTAPVIADELGSQGDIEPELKFTIPGLSAPLQEKIYGQVQSPFSGGLLKLGLLTQADVDNARTNLTNQIKEVTQVNYLSNYIATKTTDTPSLVPEVLFDIEILNETIDSSQDELISEFTLSLETKVLGAAFNRNDLEIIAQNKLIASLADGEKFIGVEPGSLQIVLKEIDLVLDQALINIAISGQSLLTQASQVIDKKQIIGQTKAELIDYFSTLAGVNHIEVSFSPFWVSRVPRTSKNINIKVQEAK
jgi:hypothetical protein